MAAKKAPAPKSMLPKGFRQARSRLDGFMALEKGNLLVGILRGSYDSEGEYGTRKVYRVEVTDGECQVADGEMVGAGAMVGVNEKGYTKALGDLEPGTKVAVAYVGLGEVKKKGQNAPHVFEIGVQE